MEIRNTIFVIPVLWILMLLNVCDTAKVFKNLTLTIDPPWVRRGQSAQLYCIYDLKGTPLYSVKWYRGNLEFYRYSPFENPSAKIFPYTGIKVDLSVSNATQVTLRNVGFNLSGNFTCEVTADAPSFYTAMATNILTVVELPHSPPTLYTERERYDPGDILRANCSTPPSKPGANITFLLNNYSVGVEPIIYYTNNDNLQLSTLILSIQVLPSHYQNGLLILKCNAEIGTLYYETTETLLSSTRKEPIPERVTSPNDGTKQVKPISLITIIIILNMLTFLNALRNIIR